MYFVVLLKNLTVGPVSEVLSVLVKFLYILCLANDFGHIFSQSRGQGRCGKNFVHRRSHLSHGLLLLEAQGPEEFGVNK